MDPLDVDREFYDLIRARYCSRPYEAKPGVWVRCGSRLKDQCESCAELFRGDWAAIARSGIFDEDETVVPGYRYAFLTLTAPSFGKVDETGAALDPVTYDYLGQVTWNYASSALWRDAASSAPAVRGAGVLRRGRGPAPGRAALSRHPPHP